MKVYVHGAQRTIPFIAQPDTTIGYVANVAGAVLNESNCTLSRTPNGPAISSHININTFFEPNDDIFLHGDEETKKAPTVVPTKEIV